MADKNLCGKTVKQPYRENAYEVWATPDGSWTWYVLKKYQANDNKKFAIWFALVDSPFVPDGELGDTYVADVKENAVRIR